MRALPAWLANAGAGADDAGHESLPRGGHAHRTPAGEPGITAAIVGARHPDQISAWASAGGFQLSEGDLDAVAQALTRTGAGAGPTCPSHTVTHR